MSRRPSPPLLTSRDFSSALEKMDLELGLGADVLAAQLHLDVEKIRGLSGELSIAA
jgi:hypothetical protein